MGRLRKLRFKGGEWLSDATYGQLDQLAGRLEFLSISCAVRMAGKGLAALGRLTQLERLKMNFASRMPAAAFIAAFSGGRLGRKLVDLELWGCAKLNDDCVRAVAEHCPVLRTLDLGECEMVTDVGLTWVVDRCQSLSRLYLRWVQRSGGNLFLPY